MGADHRKHEFFQTSTQLCRDLRGALPTLLLAYKCAHDVQTDVWDFAVENSFLQSAGLTNTEIRWLVSMDYVEHREEDTLPGQAGRSFRPANKLVFGENSCFVLTQRGVEFSQQLLAEQYHGNGVDSSEGLLAREELANRKVRSIVNGRSPDAETDESNAADFDIPLWDPHRRELHFMGKLVKQFKLPSPNQESLLNAFAEEGWPPRIDNPLLPQPEQNCKSQLNNSIKGLNRNQKHSLIRFKGDGTGEGVIWEPVG